MNISSISTKEVMKVQQIDQMMSSLTVFEMKFEKIVNSSNFILIVSWKNKTFGFNFDFLSSDKMLPLK